MPDRTLVQITKEIDQLAGEITSLDAQIEAKRQKLTELVREQARTQSDTLARFGMRLVLENSRDSLPVETAKSPRKHKPSKSGNGSEGPDTKTLREWATATDWKYGDSPISTWPNRIPAEVRSALLVAYSAKHQSG